MKTEEKTPEQIAHEFVMPEVQLGTAVMFHPNHDLTHPHLGWIVRLGKTGRNCVIRTSDRMVHDGVKHVSDPRLDWNNDHRESGSWDFTDEHKRLEKEREELKARVAALEFAATKTAGRRKKSSE